MDQSAVWRIGLSLYEHGLLTSRPDERNLIREHMKQAGSLRGGISAWVDQLNKEEAQSHGSYL